MTNTKRREFLLHSSTTLTLAAVSSLGVLQACTGMAISQSNPKGSKAMTSNLTAQFFEAYNASDWQRLRQYVTLEIVYFEPATGRRIEGIDAYMASNQGWKAAFPDLTGVVKNEILNGDAQTLEILWTGTHTGTLQSAKGPIPATGKKMQVPAAAWITLRDGKYNEIRHYFDLLSMLTQLGLA